MTEFLSQNINTGLYIIYGLVVLVVVLIVVVVVLDRKETKRRRQNEKLLSNTLNFKPIKDDSYIDKNVDEIEVVDLQKEKVEEEPITEEEDVFEEELPVQQKLDLDFEDDTDEDELGKTQAQIRIEEITKALEKAVMEEKQKEEDKYAKFEEEQEKNAIISYKELKESFDKLYEENEKVQYVDDDSIPININELYEYNKTSTESVDAEPVEVKVEEPKKVKLEDFNEGKRVFKSSPYISPVYGIQKPTEVVPDNEITNANSFLNDLKELRDNLE